MSATQMPQLVDITESAQPQLYASSIITYCLAVTALGLRFLSRRLLRSGYWLDDWFSAAALAMATGFLVSTLVWIHQGYGKHYEVLGPDFVAHALKNLFTGEILYCLTLCCAKFSILCFCWRLFSSSVSIRVPIYTLGAVVTAWTIAVIFVTIFQCIPVAGFWNKSLNPKCSVKVWDFFLGNAIPNILTDVALMALPLPYIWSLNRSRSSKIALGGIFLLGGFVIIVSIVRLVILVRLDLVSPDLDWNLAPVGVWTETEANIAIVCACLPSCKPILSLILTGSASGTKGSGYPSDKGPKISMPHKKSHASSSTSDDDEGREARKDDRRLFIPLEDRSQHPWTHPHGSHTVVTGPSSQDDTSRTPRSDPASQRLNGRGKERTRDPASANSPGHSELEANNKAFDNAISVRNDFDVQWVRTEQ